MAGAISVATEANAYIAWRFDMMEVSARKLGTNCKGMEKGGGDDC